MRDALRRLRWWLIVRLAGQDTVALNLTVRQGALQVRVPGLVRNVWVEKSMGSGILVQVPHA